MDKQQLRKNMLLKRKAMSKKEVEEKSRIICEKICGHPFYLQAENLCLYMPVNNEVDVTGLLTKAAAQGKKIWLPKVLGKDMEFFAYTGNRDLVNGAFNIMEPSSSLRLEPDEDTCMIVPGSVFSSDGKRAGYGGGFYDRYLAEYTQIKTIGVCYAFQVEENLEILPHDILMQAVITEKGL